MGHAERTLQRVIRAALAVAVAAVVIVRTTLRKMLVQVVAHPLRVHRHVMAEDVNACMPMALDANFAGNLFLLRHLHQRLHQHHLRLRHLGHRLRDAQVARFRLALRPVHQGHLTISRLAWVSAKGVVIQGPSLSRAQSNLCDVHLSDVPQAV